MRLDLFKYFVVAAIAFYSGYHHPQNTGRLELASEDTHHLLANINSFNSYELLPCPSDEKVTEWKSRININFGNSQATCEDLYGGKFLKLLNLAATIETNLPENWGGMHRESLENPLEYILKMTKNFSIDLSQQNAIASNFLGQQIFLGSLFFELNPLDALQVLIHESRHSSLLDPKHVDCRTGDIPKSARACDETFSIDHHAGAYSYGFVFQLGLSLYGKGLSDADREFLRDSALLGITKRFNRVPESLALPLDLLFILKEDRIYQVQPFTLELIEIKGPAGFENDRPMRIQYDPIYQGILVFNESGRVYAIDQNRKFKPYYDDLLPYGMRLIDSNKVYSSAGKYAYTYFLATDNRVYFKEVDKDTGKSKLSEIDFQPKQTMKRFFTADGFGAFFLSDEGKLFRYQTGKRGLKAEPYIEEKDFTLDGQSWQDVTGGATYDALIGVADDGLIYTNFRSEASTDYKPQRLVYKSNAPLKKYQEGLNIKVALGSKGQVFIQDYAESTPKPWILPLENVQDFAIGRLMTGTDLFSTQRRLNDAEISWAKTCAVEKPLFNPWTNSAFGLNSKGYLVFFESSKPCQQAIHIDRAKHLSTRLVGSDLYKAFNYFSQVHLEMKGLNDEPIKWKPYSPLYPLTTSPY